MSMNGANRLVDAVKEVVQEFNSSIDFAQAKIAKIYSHGSVTVCITSKLEWLDEAIFIPIWLAPFDPSTAIVVAPCKASSYDFKTALKHILEKTAVKYKHMLELSQEELKFVKEIESLGYQFRVRKFKEDKMNVFISINNDDIIVHVEAKLHGSKLTVSSISVSFADYTAFLSKRKEIAEYLKKNGIELNLTWLSGFEVKLQDTDTHESINILRKIIEAVISIYLI